MSSTLVIQSHNAVLPFKWLEDCMRSVRLWADSNHFDYQFFDDRELFASVAPELLEKTAGQIVIATDLGRLKLLQTTLNQGYQTVIWCDADFLIFNPDAFVLPQTEFALGRELWVQLNDDDKLKAYRKVHNAFLMFRQGNSFLDFYTDTAQRLLSLNQGAMPPQFIGPKLLTALHNIAVCPVMENAGMLSPLVMRDLMVEQGKALDLFRLKSAVPIDGANLSASLTLNERFEEADMQKVISRLKASGC